MNDNINLLAFCEACSKQNNLVLQEFTAPVLDSYFKPVSPATYRLVNASTGKIITYGTIETIYSYFTMRNERF